LVDGVCSIYVRDEKYIQDLSESLREDLEVHGKIILKWTLNKVQGCRLNLRGSKQGAVAVSCEHGNEPSGSVKDRIYQLLKKDSVPWSR
jgi:hypothetical protein